MLHCQQQTNTLCRARFTPTLSCHHEPLPCVSDVQIANVYSSWFHYFLMHFCNVVHHGFTNFGNLEEWSFSQRLSSFQSWTAIAEFCALSCCTWVQTQLKSWQGEVSHSSILSDTITITLCLPMKLFSRNPSRYLQAHHPVPLCPGWVGRVGLAPESFTPRTWPSLWRFSTPRTWESRRRRAAASQSQWSPDVP